MELAMFKDYRCSTDGKLLFKGILVEGKIELKCKSCHTINVFEPTPMKDLICHKPNCPNRVS